MMHLFVVTLWVAGDQFAYAVGARDREEAEKFAAKMHAEDFETSEKIEIDPEMTFEITCVSDIDGRNYDIVPLLTSRPLNTKREQKKRS